jgi:glycosyltransferase involved in cell wall biosynthesis
MRSIAMLSNLYPPVTTGSSIHCSTLAKKLVEQGISVIVFTPRVDKNAPEHEFLDGVEVFRLPCLKLPKLPIAVNFPWLSVSMLPSNIKRMRDIMRERSVELMHVHNHMFDMALNGVILKKMLNIPLVLSIHSIIFHPNPVCNAILSSIDATFLRWCMVRRATHLVDLDRVCTRYRKRRFGVDKGTLIPLATDFPEPPNPADIAMLKEKYGLEGKKVMLSVGHLHHLRNRMALIRGFANSLKSYPEARLLIVGARNYAPAEELVKHLGVTKQVIFTGNQPRHLVSAFFELCDAHSMWFDFSPHGDHSVGNANIEAMFMGKPVFGPFAPDVFGEGVLKHEENVFILPDTNMDEPIEKTILTIWRDEPLAAEMGKKARETVRKYLSWDVAVKHHISLYSSLIEKKEV